MAGLAGFGDVLALGGIGLGEKCTKWHLGGLSAARRGFRRLLRQLDGKTRFRRQRRVIDGGSEFAEPENDKRSAENRAGGFVEFPTVHITARRSDSGPLLPERARKLIVSCRRRNPYKSA